MKKNLLLKTIILLICIIIIIVVMLLYILLNNEEILKNNNIENIEGNLQKINSAQQFEEYKMFYTIDRCINYYIEYCQIENKQTEYEQGISFYEDEIIGDNDKLQSIYNILDVQYIKEKNITINNIREKVKIYQEKVKFKLIKFKELEKNEIESYAVYGKIEKKDNLEKIEDVYFIVNIDTGNNLFSIIPLQDENIMSIDDISKENANKELERNTDNIFGNVELSDSEIGVNCFEDFKQRMILQKEDAYNILKKEYRDKKYTEMKDFENYVENNIDYIKNIQIEEISTENIDKLMVYKCTDQYGNNYIIEQETNTHYTMQLDDYTLEDEAIIQTYEEFSNKDKAFYNINKFFKMINTKDYETAYSVLDDSFKQNYFKTQEDFENYIYSNMFKYNKIVDKKYSNKILGLNIYDIEISDMIGQTIKTKKLTMIVKLLEDRNFVMSFEVN